MIQHFIAFCATSYVSFIRYNGQNALCFPYYHVSLYLHQHIILMTRSLCAKKEVCCSDSLYFPCVQPPVKCLLVTQIVHTCRVWIWMLMHPKINTQFLFLLKLPDWDGLTLLCKNKILHYNPFSCSKVVTYIPTDKITLIDALQVCECV